MKKPKDRIEIMRADITKLTADAIVNAANSSLLGGGGVDGAIHRAAGPELRSYCAELHGCKTGQAKTSPGFNLPAKFVIHTVGPIWSGGHNNEEYLLGRCYANSLDEARAHECRTIAFPSISTGAFGFPFDKACNVALKSIYEFLNQNEIIDKVWLVTFGETDFVRYCEIYEDFFSD